MNAPRNLRIGIDARLGHRQGVGRHIAELIGGVSSLAPSNEYIVYVKPHAAETFVDRFRGRGNLRWVSVPGTPFRPGEHVAMGRALRRDRLDLLHVTFDYGTPLWAPCPLILTVHDAWFEAETFFRSGWTRRYFQTMTRLGLKRARRIVTVSQFVKDKVVAYHPWLAEDEGRIRVCHNGVGTEFTPGLSRRPPLLNILGGEDYLLYVGVLARNKNIIGLLEAYAALVARRPNVPPLILGGKRDPHHPDPQIIADRLGLGRRAHFVGFVPDAVLPDVYRGARLLVFPSLHEGFGIPVLEAMACGVPVVTSKTTALPEVAGDAAMLVDPGRPEAIAAGMEAVLFDEALRGRLIDRGLRRAKRFSWEQMARDVLAVYREAV